MISSLKVTVKFKNEGGEEYSFDVALKTLELLALMQQVLPDTETAPGAGTLVSPWKPTKPGQWFYCAKVCAIGQRHVHKRVEKDAKQLLDARNSKATTLQEITQDLDKVGGHLVSKAKALFPNDTAKAWLEVGGRVMQVKVSNLYSSDCGAAPIPSSSEPTAVYPDASYPTILGKLQRSTATDTQIAETILNILSGLKKPPGPNILPLLTNVLFISEVARNHTAFHSALMLLDLLNVTDQKRINLLPTGKLTLAKAIWGSGENTTSCYLCLGSRQLTLPCKYCQARTCRNSRCRGTYTANCYVCNATGTVIQQEMAPLGVQSGSTVTIKGGVSKLQAGLLPMSHTGSAHGSAYDLTGKGDYFGVKGKTEAFGKLPIHTIVRRKEATVLAQWLILKLQAYPQSKQADLAFAGLTSLSFTVTALTSDTTDSKSEGEKAYSQLEDELAELMQPFKEQLELLKGSLRDMRGLEKGSQQKRPQVYPSRMEGSAEKEKERNTADEALRKTLGGAAAELRGDLDGRLRILVRTAVLELLQQRVSSSALML